MADPTLAWGELRLFQMADGAHIYGREFELLPSSMLGARAILHGLCGMPATMEGDSLARVATDAVPDVYAIRQTTPEELGDYCATVLKGFRIRQLQDAQG